MGAVVGENVRRLREQRGQTRAEAAQLLQEHGLAWQRDHLTNVELRRRPVIELNALILLADAYSVPLHELFAGDGEVQLSESVSVDRKQVRRVLSGHKLGPRSVTVRRQIVASVEADQKAGKRLDLPVRDVIAIARELWGHTLTDERDHRLGDLAGLPPRTVQAKRGAMTRQLTTEVADHLARRDAR